MRVPTVPLCISFKGIARAACADRCARRYLLSKALSYRMPHEQLLPHTNCSKARSRRSVVRCTHVAFQWRSDMCVR